MKLFSMDEAELKKGNGYHTAVEIMQQPKVWRQTLGIMETKKDAIENFLCEPLLSPNVRIIFTGAGTSNYVGNIVAPYLKRVTGLRMEAIATTDLVANPEDYFEKATPTILVSCARSGNSPESVATYDIAEQLIKHLYQVIITCNSDGDLARRTIGKKNNLLLEMPKESNDKGFAMTSSFSCMVLAALLVFDMKRFNDNKRRVDGMIVCAQSVLQEADQSIRKIIASDYTRCVFLGSAVLKGIAQEAALKTLELSSGATVAVSESVLGFRHGPKCIIDNKTVVFVFLSNQPYTRQYDIDILKELFREKGEDKIVAVSYAPDECIRSFADYILVVNENGKNDCDDAYAAIVYVLYAQIYALLNSFRLGITPDNPKPDGTVNRVVQGVITYPYCKY